MTRTYFLSASELAGTRVKVERVTARARRRGFTGRFELAAVPAERTIRTEAGTNRTVCGFDVTLTGSAPSYAGWSFIAAVDAAPAGAVIRSAPSAAHEISPESITPGLCEHCGKSRSRKHTYLVRSEETGEVKQVGKTCMKDFLGWDVTPVFIDEDSVEEDLFGGFYGGLRGRVFDAPLIEVARVAFAAVDALGYSSNRYGKISTRQVVATILDEAKGADELREQLAHAMLDDATVNERLDIVRGTLTEPAGFEANLRTILAGEVVQRGHLGLAATVGLVYQRVIKPAAQTAPEHVSKWIGDVTEKITVEGTIIQAMTIDGHYGASRLMIVAVGDGDRVKMFTTAAWAWDVGVDETVTLTGTVKAHEEYQGRRETLLVRPKLVEAHTINTTLTDGEAA
jgi:hypothetical protein